MFNIGALGMAAVHTEETCGQRRICSCTVHITQYCTTHSILYLLCAAQCAVHVCSSRADTPSQGRALASAGFVIYAGNHRGSLVQ